VTAGVQPLLAAIRACLGCGPRNGPAPIFEEKVVDFLVELAKVTEKAVSREELYKEDDEAPAAGGQG
jgi:hypothetical protein